MNNRSFSIALCLAITALVAPSQSPITADYTIRADPADLSGITVEMQIRNAPTRFRVAMVTHTEYDDEYWRYLTELHGESGSGVVRIAREDSSLWRVVAPAGLIRLRYRVRFPSSPPMQQASWMAHLTSAGGLLGGPHSFLYVVGAERSPVRLTVVLPDAWRVVTGLDTADAPRTFTAPNISTLVDSPMLVGMVRSWRFDIDGVPHDVSYLGRADGTAFDTTLFVGNVERLARTTVAMFGRMPYRHYHFLFEDGAYGGLEHTNSVSMGAKAPTSRATPTPCSLSSPTSSSTLGTRSTSGQRVG